MEKSSSIFKGLGFAYLLTMVMILVYNLLLTYTNMSANSINMVASSITTLSAAIGGFYASQKIKEKGLIYGMAVGILYIICLVLISYLAKEKFAFEMTLIYKALLTTVAGGIGGVLGVNFK